MPLRITVGTEEAIYIGKDKEITVRIRHHGNLFSVSIDAPLDIKILRESAVNQEPKENRNHE